MPRQQRLAPIRFILYQFSLFAACFPVVFAVDTDYQKRNLSGTDRTRRCRHAAEQNLRSLPSANVDPPSYQQQQLQQQLQQQQQ
jgi:hypothetical protein